MTFKDKMIDYVVSQVVASFLKSLSPQELKVVLDAWIDKAEDVIKGSANPFDDHLLPVLRFARDFFNIPDLPDK